MNPEPFLKFGKLSFPLWCIYEMTARQEYYVQKFSDKIKMVEVTFDEAVTDIGTKNYIMIWALMMIV